MSTLGVAIGTADTVIIVPGGLTVGSFPAPFTIDSEYILVSGGGSGLQFYSVERGQNGSARATHALGATITSGWSAAGSTPDLAAVLAVGAAAGGVGITGLADPSGAQDAATKHYVDNAAPTLAAVLAAGHDANGVDITGADSITGRNSVTIAGNDTGSGATANEADLQGGFGNAGTSNPGIVAALGGAGDGSGGGITLSGGDAVGTNTPGGDVTFHGGAKNGSGRNGQVVIDNIPTADPHVANALYSVTGILHISAG